MKRAPPRGNNRRSPPTFARPRARGIGTEGFFGRDNGLAHRKRVISSNRSFPPPENSESWKFDVALLEPDGNGLSHGEPRSTLSGIFPLAH